MRVRTKIVFYLLLLIALLPLTNTTQASASDNAGELIINEISIKDGTNDWIELYVVDGSVGWTNYRVYRDDTNYIEIPACGANWNTGDYIVIHEEAGTDDVDIENNDAGYWDLYGIGDLTATDGVIRITNPNTDSTYVDALIYSNNNGKFTASKTRANDIVSDDLWNPDYIFGNAEPTGDSGAWIDSDDVDAGESIGRDSSSTDTNNKDDWHHFITGTPGEANPSGGSSGDIDILINEVAPSESGGADWIELYNASGSSKNIQYWAVKERSTKVKTLPDLTMDAGEYLVLHFNSSTADEADATGDTNENGYWDVYTTDTGLVGTDNVVVLYDPVNAIIDAMAWSNIDGTWATAQQKAFNTIVTANEWAGTVDGGASVNEPECAPGSGVWDETAGHSLGRNISSADNNDKDDWSLDVTPTKGRNNGSAPISARITNLRVSNDPFFADGSDSSRTDTTISFNLAVDSEVSLRIYDAEGRVVKTLMDNSLRLSGKNEAIWDGRDGSGGVVPIGTYIICVEAASLDDQSNDGAITTVTVARFLSSDEFECFIATAAFSGSRIRDPGSQLNVLRKFRDEYFLTNGPGRAFVRFYYRASPPVANFIRERESLKAVVRVMLWPVVKFAKLVLGR